MTFYEIVNLSNIVILELGAAPAMASCTSGVTAVHAQDKDIPVLAAGVMKVTRLLPNNPRKLTQKDAEAIYRSVLYAFYRGIYNNMLYGTHPNFDNYITVFFIL